jgi:mono/diheme cytochrome c family protein
MIKALSLITAVVLFLSNCVFAAARPPQDAASAPAPVKMLYERDCAICHGAQGDGKTDIAKERQFALLDWTDPKSLSGISDQQLFSLIRNGKGKMPAESVGRAGNDEVRALIQYIRGLAKSDPPPASGAPPASNPELSGNHPVSEEVLSPTRDAK